MEKIIGELLPNFWIKILCLYKFIQIRCRLTGMDKVEDRSKSFLRNAVFVIVFLIDLAGRVPYQDISNIAEDYFDGHLSKFIKTA